MNRRRGVAFGCWVLCVLMLAVGSFPAKGEADIASDVAGQFSWLIGCPTTPSAPSMDVADLQCGSNGTYTCDYPKIQNNQECLRGKTCAEIKDGCTIAGICDAPNHCQAVTACGKPVGQATCVTGGSGLPANTTPPPTVTVPDTSNYQPSESSSPPPASTQTSGSANPYGTLEPAASTPAQQPTIPFSTDVNNYSAPAGAGVSSPLTEGTVQDVTQIQIPPDNRISSPQEAQDAAGSTGGTNGASTFLPENDVTPPVASASSCGVICSVGNGVSNAVSNVGGWVSNTVANAYDWITGTPASTPSEPALTIASDQPTAFGTTGLPEPALTIASDQPTAFGTAPASSEPAPTIASDQPTAFGTAPAQSESAPTIASDQPTAFGTAPSSPSDAVNQILAGRQQADANALNTLITDQSAIYALKGATAPSAYGYSQTMTQPNMATYQAQYGNDYAALQTKIEEDQVNYDSASKALQQATNDVNTYNNGGGLSPYLADQVAKVNAGEGVAATYVDGQVSQAVQEANNAWTNIKNAWENPSFSTIASAVNTSPALLLYPAAGLVQSGNSLAQYFGAPGFNPSPDVVLANAGNPTGAAYQQMGNAFNLTVAAAPFIGGAVAPLVGGGEAATALDSTIVDASGAWVKTGDSVAGEAPPGGAAAESARVASIEPPAATPATAVAAAEPASNVIDFSAYQSSKEISGGTAISGSGGSLDQTPSFSGGESTGQSLVIDSGGTTGGETTASLGSSPASIANDNSFTSSYAFDGNAALKLDVAPTAEVNPSQPFQNAGEMFAANDNAALAAANDNAAVAAADANALPARTVVEAPATPVAPYQPEGSITVSSSAELPAVVPANTPASIAAAEVGQTPSLSEPFTQAPYLNTSGAINAAQAQLTPLLPEVIPANTPPAIANAAAQLTPELPLPEMVYVNTPQAIAAAEAQQTPSLSEPAGSVQYLNTSGAIAAAQAQQTPSLSEPFTSTSYLNTSGAITAAQNQQTPSLSEPFTQVPYLNTTDAINAAQTQQTPTLPEVIPANTPQSIANATAQETPPLPDVPQTSAPVEVPTTANPFNPDTSAANDFWKSAQEGLAWVNKMALTYFGYGNESTGIANLDATKASDITANGSVGPTAGASAPATAQATSPSTAQASLPPAANDNVGAPAPTVTNPAPANSAPTLSVAQPSAVPSGTIEQKGTTQPAAENSIPISTQQAPPLQSISHDVNSASPIVELKSFDVTGLNRGSALQAVASQEPAPAGYQYMYRGLKASYENPTGAGAQFYSPNPDAALSYVGGSANNLDGTLLRITIPDAYVMSSEGNPFHSASSYFRYPNSWFDPSVSAEDIANRSWSNFGTTKTIGEWGTTWAQDTNIPVAAESSAGSATQSVSVPSAISAIGKMIGALGVAIGLNSTPASAIPYNPVSGTSLADAVSAACTAVGCSAHALQMMQQAEGGVCAIESVGCNAQVQHVGYDYQGFGQVGTPQTQYALNALDALAQSPKLSAAQQAEVRSVVKAARAIQAKGGNPNADSILGPWILVGFHLASGSFADVSTATADPMQATGYLMVGQMAPDTYIGAFNPNKQISFGGATGLIANGYLVYPGMPASQAAKAVLAKYGPTSITAGVTWMKQYASAAPANPAPFAVASAPSSAGPYTKANVTIVGDSEGYGAGTNDKFTNVVAQKNAHIADTVTVNGQVVLSAKDQIAKLPSGTNAIVFIGTNDAGNGVAKITADMKAMSDAANSHGVKIVAVVGPSRDPGDANLNAELTQADPIVKAAVPAGAGYVDLGSIPNSLRDGYHFTPEGFQKIGDMALAKANTPVQDTGIAVASNAAPAAPAPAATPTPAPSPSPSASAPAPTPSPSPTTIVTPTSFAPAKAQNVPTVDVLLADNFGNGITPDTPAPALAVAPPAAAPPSAVAEIPATSVDLSAANQDIVSAETKLAQTKRTISADQSQLATLKTQADAAAQKIAAIDTVVQVGKDIAAAQAGLNVLNSFGMLKQTASAEDTQTMAAAAAATSRLANEIPALAPQINSYINLLDSMKQKENQTLSNLSLAKSQGAVLVKDVADAEKQMSKNVAPGDLPGLQTTSAKLAANINALNKTIVALQKTAGQQLADVTKTQQRMKELSASAQIPDVWKPIATPAAATPQASPTPAESAPAVATSPVAVPSATPTLPPANVAPANTPASIAAVQAQQTPQLPYIAVANSPMSIANALAQETPQLVNFIPNTPASIATAQAQETPLLPNVPVANTPQSIVAATAQETPPLPSIEQSAATPAAVSSPPRSASANASPAPSAAAERPTLMNTSVEANGSTPVPVPWNDLVISPEAIQNPEPKVVSEKNPAATNDQTTGNANAQTNPGVAVEPQTTAPAVTGTYLDVTAVSAEGSVPPQLPISWAVLAFPIGGISASTPEPSTSEIPAAPTNETPPAANVGTNPAESPAENNANGNSPAAPAPTEQPQTSVLQGETTTASPQPNNSGGEAPAAATPGLTSASAPAAGGSGSGEPPTTGGGTPPTGGSAGGSGIGGKIIGSTLAFCTGGIIRFGICVGLGSGVYSGVSHLWSGLWSTNNTQQTPPNNSSPIKTATPANPTVLPVVPAATPPANPAASPKTPPANAPASPTASPPGAQPKAPAEKAPAEKAPAAATPAAPEPVITPVGGGTNGGGSNNYIGMLLQILGNMLGQLLGQHKSSTSSQLTPASVSVPSVSVRAIPSSVPAGEPATLVWWSTSTSACKIIQQGGTVLGVGAANGSTSTPPINVSSVFIVQCTTYTGAVVSNGATVSIIPPASEQ